ncbi:hypothetical protein N8737_04865, partial [Verrucomicrobia bacterium]|nr:hypothetical protein [Verrucomicrobiota bacterium]
AAYEKQIAPIIEQRESDREREIGGAKGLLVSYQEKIAPREAKAEADRLAGIEAAEKAIADYHANADEALEAWESSAQRATAWSPIDARKLTASNKANLVLQRDGSVLASGENGKGTYEIVTTTSLTAISGIKLEALTDESLPKNGPGRPGDGNFVLSEIELYWAPASDPTKQTKVALEKPQADFSQKEFGIVDAIDGRVDGANNGWAISPKCSF